MIDKVAEYIVKELNSYFKLLSSHNADIVKAANLFDLAGGVNQRNEKKLIVSVVNIEQDPTYHSLEIYQKDAEGNNQLVKPEVKINVYFLMIPIFQSYRLSLDTISQVIAFFQHRKSFDIPKPNESSTNHVVFEMVSMSFEQQNHLWGMLGGKYFPSVMYKAGILDIRDERAEYIVPSVQDIKVNE